MLQKKKIKMVEGTQSNREPFVTEQIHLKQLCLWGWNLHRDLGEVRVSQGEARREEFRRMCQLHDPGQGDNFCEPPFPWFKITLITPT